MFDKGLITENRLASAKKKELTPLRIFPDNQNALFSGSSGDIYETSLDACSCPDFAIQGYAQPCKHMLRLAMELNMIPSDGMQSDREAAEVKYYIGCARTFAREADFPEFIRFSREFISLDCGKQPEDNFLCEKMDIQSFEDCPIFKINKSGKISVVRKWDKEFESIKTTICNRLGRDLLYWLNDDEFVSMICKE